VGVLLITMFHTRTTHYCNSSVTYEI